MTKVTPINKVKIVKKRTKSFERHQHQQFWRIGRSSWRKQKGINNIIIVTNFDGIIILNI